MGFHLSKYFDGALSYKALFDFIIKKLWSFFMCLSKQMGQCDQIQFRISVVIMGNF